MEIKESEKQEFMNKLDVEGIKEAIKEMIIYHAGEYKEPLKMLIMKNGERALVSQHAYCADGDNYFNTCQAILIEGNQIIYNPEEIEGFTDYGQGITTIKLGSFNSDEDVGEVFEKALAEEIFKNMLDDSISRIN